VGLAGLQNLLKRRFELRACSDERPANGSGLNPHLERARPRQERWQFCPRFFRASTDSIIIVASRSPSGLSGHKSAWRSYSLRSAPRSTSRCRDRSRECHSVRDTSRRASADTASSSTATAPAPRVDAIEDHAVKPDVQRLFDYPLGLVRLGRKARETGPRSAAGFPSLSTMPLSVIPNQEHVSAGKSSGLCSRSARQNPPARGRPRALYASDRSRIQAVDGLAFHELCNHGVQMQSLLLPDGTPGVRNTPERAHPLWSRSATP